MYFLDDSLDIIFRFMEQGGTVLWFIAALTFVMWTLVFERFWYFKTSLPGDNQSCD